MLDNTSGYRYTIDNKDERGTEPMIIDDLLRDAKMSQYKLSKESSRFVEKRKGEMVWERRWGDLTK